MADHGWQEHTTEDGRVYFHNKERGISSWEKPEEMKTRADRELAGEWVWMPHQDEGFLPARVTKREKKKIKLQTESNKTYTVSDKVELVTLERHLLKKGVEDLVQMERVDEPMILHVLRQRFMKDLIYTNIGTILVAINPYKMFPVYGKENMVKYRDKGMENLPPHIFDIAANSYRDMVDGASSNKFADQSILVSGESGAGKTVATKHVLSYLAEVAGSVDGEIAQKILVANPVLEAFGNAKTIVNDNSSRFGKWIEVLFDKRLRICGARIINYLLEKARVTDQHDGERNFHIFYQLTNGAPDRIKDRLRLGPAHTYEYAFKGRCTEVNTIDDASDFDEVLDAMMKLGFTREEQDVVFQLTAAVLHIGNIQLAADGDGSKVSDREELENAAYLLGIAPMDLERTIVTRTLRVRGQDPVHIPLSPNKAHSNAAALAKSLYNNLFDWLVQRINEFIMPARNQGPYTMIGVLDIFGFEIFELNSFEQLCINYTNEMLQQHFNNHTFKEEEELYRSEGIRYEHIKFIDNQICLDLIEAKPDGILCVLDEELVVPKGSDKGFLRKLHERQDKNNKRYSRDLQDQTTFNIKHYAGKVTYETTGFLEKNKDTVEADLLALMSSSEIEFLQNLFSDTAAKFRKTSIGTQFKGQLARLMETLNRTSPHYVRCIKSNSLKRPLILEGRNCLLQLRYSGVFEAVRIRQSGFPFRYTHHEFVWRYQCLLHGHNTRGMHDEDICTAIINAMGADWEDIQIGVTRVLYRADVHRNLELLRSVEVEARAVVLQAAARGMRARKLFKRMKEVDHLLREAIASRNLDRIERVLERCEGIWFFMRSLKDAHDMKARLLEEQRITEGLSGLESKDPEVHYDEMMTFIRAAEAINFESRLVSKVSDAVYDVRQRRETLENLRTGIREYDQTMLEAAIKKATLLEMFSEDVAEAKKVLQYIETERAVTRHLEAAIERQDGDIASVQLALEEAIAFGLKTPEGAVLREQAKATLELRKALHANNWDALEAAVKDMASRGLETQEMRDAEQRLALRERMRKLAAELEDAMGNTDEERLLGLCATADELGMLNSPWGLVVERAQEMLDNILEMKRLLEEGVAAVDEDMLVKAVRLAEQYNYQTEQVETATRVRDQIVFLHEAANEALCFYDAPQMKLTLKRAHRIGLNAPYIAKMETVLVDITEKKVAPVPEVFFEQFLDETFSLADAPALRSPAEYAEAKKGVMKKKKKLAASMLRWSPESMPTSLTYNLSERDVLRAVKFSEKLTSYIDPSTYDGDDLPDLMYHFCDDAPEFRDECYFQLIKYATDNPDEDSLTRLWHLVFTTVSTFPPSQLNEHRIEWWLRQDAPEPSLFLDALHTIIYSERSLERWPRQTFGHMF